MDESKYFAPAPRTYSPFCSALPTFAGGGTRGGSCSSSIMFLLQAVVLWSILVIPPVTVTLVLYIQQQEPPPAVAAEGIDVNFSVSISEPATTTAADFIGSSETESMNTQKALSCFQFSKDLLEKTFHADCESKNSNETAAVTFCATCLESVAKVTQSDLIDADELCSQKEEEEEAGQRRGKNNNCFRLLANAVRKGIGSSSIDAQSAAANSSSIPSDTDSCYELISEYQNFLVQSRYWIKGVALTALGVFGLIGNAVTIIVLSSTHSNRNFNKLLITLASIDSLLILYFVLEKSIIETFCNEEPVWYRYAYPYFLYPISGVIKTLTIFMVVGISAERYGAICHPLKQRQKPIKFIAYVFFLSVTLEFPRWFEFQLIVSEDSGAYYWTTDLFENPSYIRFTSYWGQLISTGIVPLLALVYFNMRIYLKIRASAKFEHRYVGQQSIKGNTRR